MFLFFDVVMDRLLVILILKMILCFSRYEGLFSLYLCIDVLLIFFEYVFNEVLIVNKLWKFFYGLFLKYKYSEKILLYICMSWNNL